MVGEMSSSLDPVLRDRCKEASERFELRMTKKMGRNGDILIHHIKHRTF